MKQRIQKVLAGAGVASRRNVEEMVRQGRIAVNGKVLTELPILVDLPKDRLSIDGQPVRLKAVEQTDRVYILMNKPKGVYSTNVAQGEQVRAIDLLPPEFETRVFPVGRLDAESKGLLLLTNDGELTNRLTHPRFGVPKTYRAVVDGYVGPKQVEMLQNGVWLSDERSGAGVKATAGHIKVIHRGRERSVLDITLREGRNRQVRRMLARIGHKVRDLTRIKMGPLELGKLQTGHIRQLTGGELHRLHQFLERGEKKSREKIAPTKPRQHGQK